MEEKKVQPKKLSLSNTKQEMMEAYHSLLKQMDERNRIPPPSENGFSFFFWHGYPLDYGLGGIKRNRSLIKWSGRINRFFADGDGASVPFQVFHCGQMHTRPGKIFQALGRKADQTRPF